MKIEKINDKQIRCTLTREDLANREIEARLAVTDRNDGLGTNASHGGTKTTIELKNSKLREVISLLLIALNVLVGDDLLGVGGIDAFPIDGAALGLVSKVASEKSKEGIHLVGKLLALFSVLDGIGKAVEGIAHMTGGDVGGRVIERNSALALKVLSLLRHDWRLGERCEK